MGTKAGFVCVAQAMEGAVRVLLRFMSVCFCPCAPRGILVLRRGTAAPGRQAWGSARLSEARVLGMGASDICAFALMNDFRFCALIV